MLLVIDAGNTNIKFGVYDGERLLHRWRLATQPAQTIDEYCNYVRNLFLIDGLDVKEISAVAIASVVLPLNPALRRMTEICFNLSPLFVDHTIETELRILYDAPQNVGADRIVNALAGVCKYGAPCIVVDFGTATKFEAINDDRQYLGGAIAPGLEISMNALLEHAPRLPRVEIKRPPSVIGSSTVNALQSGLYYGGISFIDGMLKRMREELSSTVIATGGLSSLIAGGSELIEVIDDALTLDGLRLIYERSLAQPKHKDLS
jgi:type III pantothenate kinase